MYVGININGDRTFTVAVLDKYRNVVNINHFWKEGLYWFLDHSKAKIVVININLKDKENLTSRTRHLFELMNVLLENFEFEQLDMKRSMYNSKFVAVTDTDMFFKQIVRKELLPLNTREGIEQRIYNLSKAGVVIKDHLLSIERNKLKNEINAIAAAYTSYAVEKNTYYFHEEEDITFLVPEYSYVPISQRIIK
ncbi:hypothetical protein [Persephonella sp.]